MTTPGLIQSSLKLVNTSLPVTWACAVTDDYQRDTNKYSQYEIHTPQILRSLWLLKKKKIICVIASYPTRPPDT